jgi:uncharacterized protein
MSRTVRSRLRAIAATGTAALMLAACTASPNGASSGSTDTGSVPPEYQRLVLVGASQGGALYNWVVGASQIFNDKLGMETSVQASATQANALDLQSNVIKFGTTSPLDLVQVSGDPSSVETSNVRTLINAMSTPFHIVVAGDAGINNLGDLAGKGVATGVTGSIESEIAATVLECAGAQGTSIQNIGKTEGAAAFNDGAIDAWTGLGSTPTAAFLEVFESKRGAKLLPLDGDTAKCVTDKYEYLTEAVIPAGTYPNQTEAVVSLTQWFYAAVSQDMPAEVVETLFRALIDNHDQFVAALPTASEATAENTAEFVGFPIHEGTQTVLDELGLAVSAR